MYDPTVTQCLKCGKKLKHIKGSKRKMYCSVSCKNGLHQMKKRSLRPPGKPGRPKKIVPDVTVGEKTTKKSIAIGCDPVPRPAIKKGPAQIIKKPTTLAALKAMCPPDLKGLNRSEWIAKQRQKLGI